jgi:hypothetical protein
MAEAIEGAFTEYETEWNEHHQGFEASVSKVRRHGVLPYFVLRKLVLDEAENEIILVLATRSIDPLADEGIAVSWERDRWVFNLGQYFDDYVYRVRKKEIASRTRSLFTVGGDPQEGTYSERASGSATQLNSSRLAKIGNAL